MTSFITAVDNEEPTFNLTNSRLRLVSGTSNPKLAEEIASYLGIENVPLVSKRFADGELYVQIQQSIRGCDVFLIQPTCAPVNDSLMELMIMVDACKRASARQITAVIPYFGYARADRKTSGRESITAKLTANYLRSQVWIEFLPWIYIQLKYKDILIFLAIIYMDLLS